MEDKSEQKEAKAPTSNASEEFAADGALSHDESNAYAVGSGDTSAASSSEVADLTSGGGSRSVKKEKSSLLMEQSKSVPLVKVALEELTYQPLTSTATAKMKRNTTRGGDKNNRTIVLDKISTTIAPYKLTAWMGPSGSGKTSLVSVVAGLVEQSSIQGSILANGEEGMLPKQMVGVVWQDDLLLSNLTVEETISFAARLKTSRDTTDEEVQHLVKLTMEELGLLHIRDHLIGSSIANVPGISGGERKRTAVAAELVVRPSLLLLDEPTSGLDATTAHSLMTTLKDLALAGHSVAVVIHQPRTDIFKLLDHLLLLSKGHVVFDGPACSVRNYLEACSDVGALPPETGIADWLMDTVILDEAKKEQAVLAKHWTTAGPSFVKRSASSCSLHEEDKKLVKRMSTLTELKQNPQKFEASFGKQLQLLMRRTVKQQRGEKITRVSIILTLAYVAFTSLFWWRMPNTTAWVFQRNSLYFFMLIAQGNSIVVSSMTVFQRDRALLRRERAKKMYGVLPYFLAKTASDMTNNILLPMCYGIIIYFTAGLRPGVGYFFKFALGYYLTLSCAQSMGFFLSILIPSMQIALILAPPITLFFFIMGGFYIPLSNMHVGIKWASYISFARYGYSALLVNEYSDREIPCADDDVAIAVGESVECPLPGETVYEGIGIEGIFTDYWFNIAICAALNVFFLVGAYGLLRNKK